MKKAFIVLIAAAILTSCIPKNSSVSKQSVEAEDMLYITNKTVENMLSCIEDPRPGSCNETDRLLTKYPWLKTRKVNITNRNGMRQNEWDTQIRSIRKNLMIIEDKHAKYYVEKGNL